MTALTTAATALRYRTENATRRRVSDRRKMIRAAAAARVVITNETMTTMRVGMICAKEIVMMSTKKEQRRRQEEDNDNNNNNNNTEKNLSLLNDLRFSQASFVNPAFTIAATTMVDKKMVSLISQSVASFIKLYLLLLFVRVLLTWFPNVNWMRQPWAMLRQVTDPYLNLFRNLIPPIMGQIDFTPILGFMVLQFLARVLSTDPSLGRF